MSHLRNEAAAVNARINSASKAVSTLQAEAQRDIGYELVELRNALNSSSLAIKSILRKHKRRYFSLSLIQSQSQEAAILEHSINHVAEWLDNATKLAGRSHAQSQSYYLKAVDLPHTHIKPAKASVQRLKWNISTAQAQLDREMEDTKILVGKAEEELKQVRKDIAQKERSISISQQNIRNKKHEINRLERDKYYVEVRRHDKLQRAAALREEAERRRRKGKIVGFFTLGIGLGYTAYQYDKAGDIDIDAGAEERASRNLSFQINSYQSSANTLQRESEALQRDMSALQASKNRLYTDVQAQNRRISELQTQMNGLRSQVSEAQNILNRARLLDKSIDPLSNQARTLQHQLLDLKQRLDGFKAGLEEKKDETVFVNRKTSKLALNKEGRSQLMTLLAGTFQDIEWQVGELESRRKRLVRD